MGMIPIGDVDSDRTHLWIFGDNRPSCVLCP